MLGQEREAVPWLGLRKTRNMLRERVYAAPTAALRVKRDACKLRKAMVSSRTAYELSASQAMTPKSVVSLFWRLVKRYW